MHTRLKTLRDTLAKHRRGEADLEHLYTAIEDLTNMDKLLVVIVGNPIDGITVEGPFDAEGASDYHAGCDTEWWLTELHAPWDGNDLEVIPS
mgnify:FL=1